MEEEKKKQYGGAGVLFAAMLCGLIYVFDNKMTFSHNLINWAFYSFAFLLVIVACITLIDPSADSWTRLKFWLYFAAAVAVCVGLCWLWQAPVEKAVTGYCSECDRDIELTYDKEYSLVSGNAIYCEDCYDSYVAYDNELDWLLSAAVFVTETGERYHKATCQYIQNADSYYIYNIENAEYQGYTPCKVCFSDDYDWREYISY